MLPAFELSFVGFIILVVMVTQVIIPLFCGLPCFWLLSASKRLQVDLAIRAAVASVSKPKNQPTTKKNT